MRIEKAPEEWCCTLGDHWGELPPATYRVERNGICQECFETIRAYEPPEPRYEVKSHDRVILHSRTFTVYDHQDFTDIGWFTEREAEAVCKLLNEMESSDE